VRAEFERASEIYRKLSVEGRIRLVASEQANSAPGSPLTLKAFLAGLGIESVLTPLNRSILEDRRGPFDPASRMKRQFDQLVAYTQRLMHLSPFRRTEFWAEADRSSVKHWQETTARHRDYLWDEVIGRLPPASVPPNPQTRLLYDTPKWKGYEVTLEVWPGVFVDEGILTVHVAALRKVLGDTRRPPAYIETVSRSGYRFIGSVVQPVPADATVKEPSVWLDREARL
jgi:hypothetical protein